MVLDGLFFKLFVSINFRIEVFVVVIVYFGFVMVVIVLLFDLSELVEMMFIGILFVYILVFFCVLIFCYQFDVFEVFFLVFLLYFEEGEDDVYGNFLWYDGYLLDGWDYEIFINGKIYSLEVLKNWIENLNEDIF